VGGAFDPGKLDSATVAARAGRRRGLGRGGRPRGDTGPHRRANSNGTGKAGATGNASETGKHRRMKRFQTPRG